MYNPSTWTASSAAWTFSQFSISSGGNIHKTGYFTETGTYSVTVLARSSVTATLTASIGASLNSVSIAPTGYAAGFASYALSVTVASPGNLVVQLAASDGTIDVDQICLSPSSGSCFMVIDPDFRDQYSWSPIGSAVWAAADSPAAGVWIVGSGYINQSIPNSLLENGGSYSVTVRAKADAGTTLNISVDNTQMGVISITSGADYNYFSGVFSVTTAPSGGNHLFGVGRATAEGSLLLDYICIYQAAPTLYGAGPCGMTSAMVAESHRFIYNSDFSLGLHTPMIAVATGFPLAVTVVGTDNKYLPSSWSYVSEGGLYRTREGGNALGIVPLPIHPGVWQSLRASPGGGYNVLLRMRRTYANANLIVGDRSTALTPIGEWTDFGFYMTGGNTVSIKSNCIDLVSGEATWCVGGIENRADVVDVDDVYVVPGPELACGTVITTPFTPLGDCINPDSTFSSGAGTWEAGNGARILVNEADIPPGGYIRQYVPVTTDTSTWQQIVDSLAVGGNYTITIAARTQDTANSLLVAIGAYTPGEVDLDTIDFDSTSMVTTWSGNFTVSSDMVVGSGIPIQITAKDGGTLIVLMVCIRSESTITPPVGACLGSWSASGGGAALGVTINPPDYVLDQVALVGGRSYIMTAAGTRTGAGNLTIAYFSLGIAQYSMDVAADATFNVSQGFVAPSVSSGELRVTTGADVEYSSLCLQENNGLPVVNPPGPLPYPECRTENGLPVQPVPNAGFFMLDQYSVTNEYSDTATTPAAYMAELSYNYAIYPLVCTTISIANWQYAAYQSLLALLKQWFGPGSWLEKWLSDILDAIRAIQIPGGGGGGGSTFWDLLLMLLKMLLALLLKILGIVGLLFSKLIEGARTINQEVRSDSAAMYAIDCEGDGQYMCFGLAALMAGENAFGDWLNIIANIVVAMLTVSLVMWVIGQVRDMFEPGSGGGAD